MVGTAHTFHIHGHGFEVTKIGWPNYDKDGHFLTNTDDIACDNNDQEHMWSCQSARWSNSSMSKILHRGEDRKPYKDTVLVPAGGYVVVRFHADNPGK